MRYVQPAERLRLLLEAERERGAPFIDAWGRAVALTLAETAGRETWAEVFLWSKAAWQRAYENRPRATVDWIMLRDDEGFAQGPGATRAVLLA